MPSSLRQEWGGVGGFGKVQAQVPKGRGPTLSPALLAFLAKAHHWPPPFLASSEEVIRNTRKRLFVIGFLHPPPLPLGTLEKVKGPHTGP